MHTVQGCQLIGCPFSQLEEGQTLPVVKKLELSFVLTEKEGGKEESWLINDMMVKR